MNALTWSIVAVLNQILFLTPCCEIPSLKAVTTPLGRFCIFSFPSVCVDLFQWALQAGIPRGLSIQSALVYMLFIMPVELRVTLQ